ncbi:NmrA family NAD(P)-binding protein [Nocardia thailandica]
MSNRPILVTGATGKQGGATARRLLADGVPVRALVRDPDAPAAAALAAAGAELVRGDLDDPRSLDAAAAGARALFLIPPVDYGAAGWDHRLEGDRGVRAVDAARRANLDQIVFTGVATLGPAHSWGQEGKQRIEAAVAASGLRYTLLRPVRFMENYLLRTSPVDGLHDGEHRHMFPADRPVQMIAVDDIAVFAALAFADPDRFHGRVLELAGDALTPVAAAALIAAHTGTPVRYRELDEREAAALGEHLVSVWHLMRSGPGWHADLEALRVIHPGLRSLDTWLATGGAAPIAARLAESATV